MNSELHISAKTSISKYDVPLSYIKNNDVYMNDVLIYNDYTNYIPENISIGLSTDKLTRIVNIDIGNGTKKYLNIGNTPINLLISNKYYYDFESKIRYPLYYYNYINLTPSYSIPINNVVKTYVDFMVFFDSNLDYTKSDILLSVNNKNICILYDTREINQQHTLTDHYIKLYDTTISDDIPNLTPVQLNYYDVDTSACIVYISSEYYNNLQGSQSRYRKFRLYYSYVNDPVILNIKDNEINTHYKTFINLLDIDNINNKCLVDIFVLSDNKYQISCYLNGNPKEFKLTMNKLYAKKSLNDDLLNNEYRIIFDNISKTSLIEIGDAKTLFDYSIKNILQSDAIINVFIPQNTLISKKDHWYVEISSGIIYRSNEINPLTNEKGLTYSVILPSSLTNYLQYTGTAILMSNNKISLNHDNIIYSYDTYTGNIIGILVTVNNMPVKILEYDDVNRVALLDTNISYSDNIKVSYAYTKYTNTYKRICLNPTPMHSYHNYDISNKIVVFAIAAQEALNESALYSVFPFFINRFVNGKEVFYTYEDITNILSDQNAILSSIEEEDNAMSIKELMQYLKSEYTTKVGGGYPYKIPLLILGSIYIFDNVNPESIEVYDIRRLAKINIVNNSITETQKHFDTAFWNAYPISANNVRNVNIYKNILDTISIKYFNDTFDNLTEDKKNDIKNMLKSIIIKRMPNDKIPIINIIEEE